MLKIKRFLGFTDGIKEPRKTKVENELSACYRNNGSLYNAVEFLCVKLLEGCYPDKEENYQYYKRNGELSKPKTLYKYYSEDGKTYFELNPISRSSPLFSIIISSFTDPSSEAELIVIRFS